MAGSAVYDFLDRPVRELSVSNRILLSAMRGWVHAHTMGADPAGALLSALSTCPAAAAPFDRLMRALDAGSDEPMTFQRPCHDRVDEIEAVMLALWTRRGDRPGVVAGLSLLVDVAAAGTVASQMARITELLDLAPATRR